MRHLAWHLHTFRWRALAASVGVFVLVGWYSATRLSSVTEATAWDAWLLSLQGPRPGNLVLLDVTQWWLLYVLFLYLTGDIPNADLLARGEGLLPRLGSRRHWWVGKLAALGILVMAYTAAVLIAILGGAGARLPMISVIHPEIFGLTRTVEPLSLVVAVFLLVSSTLLSLAVLQWYLSLRYRSAFHGFLAVMGLMTVSLFLGMSRLVPARWLPGTQSILTWHRLYDAQVDFSISWSLLYNILLVALLLAVSFRSIVRLDILGHHAHHT